jgi:hypothetical protein
MTFRRGVLISLVAFFCTGGVVAAGCGSEDSTITPGGTGGSTGGGTPGSGGNGGTSGGCGEEICDGNDNDCDGDVDEDCACSDGETQDCYSGPRGTADVGACASGTQSCDTSGTFGECVGEVVPSDEQCDATDNDCNGTVDDGFGSVTCGLGVCQVTVDECLDGEPQPCIPGNPSPAEACDGTDDDCDGDVDEGCSCLDGDTQPCYTGNQQTQNVGECHDGTQTCSGGAWGACVGDQTPVAELCDGLDNDCDGTDDDGNPGGGGGCNTGLAGVCGPGTLQCAGGQLGCVQNVLPSADLCNNLDDDCDAMTADGSGDAAVGVACDGNDPDLCAEGLTICNGGTIACNDMSGNTLDVCNGLDDDCDVGSADGSEDPLGGTACDGVDSDLCNEGTRSCQAGVLVCGDNTSGDLDVCDGIDNDCDPASADGSEDPQNGAQCDGADSDLCNEGSRSCVSGTLVCSDQSGSTFDVCNAIDDDCDPASPNGSEDPQLGTACDGADADLCNEGSRSCVGNALVCSDNTANNSEICNGIDDDCNPATLDGAQDPQNGTACDGADSDLCNEGTRSCSSGMLVCGDNTASTLDTCNNLDDDCDPASPDGSEDPLNGTACDGVDSDLCNEGLRSCQGGALVCSDNTSSDLDVCDGVNNDCDAASADGSEDPLNGTQCDGADSDLCLEGTRSCSAGMLSCGDNTASTLDTCNGLDDDCDVASADGSEDPQNGTACDGADSDLCNEGLRSCQSGSLVCSDNTTSDLDVCDGINNDCDPASADGSEDPLNGTQCDGADSDLCLEGSRSCAAGALTCSDNTASTLDLCNLIDDDCDPASPNGSEDPQNGTACDGADTDFCNEGTRSCSSNVLVCSDNTGNNVEVCNGLDDDCNAGTVDGSQDPQNGTACDGPDGDFCNEGTRSCAGGALVCSDNTGTNVEVCNGLDDDCDGPVDEGNPGGGGGCNTGIPGPCANGVLNCSGGSLQCTQTVFPVPEDCSNAIDDDCNGVVNNGCGCSHPLCSTGVALTNNCNACVGSICAVDPYCCNISWDSICVGEVRTVCNSLTCAESQGSCPTTLCNANGFPLPFTNFCDQFQANCVQTICGLDPYCCQTDWDGICVGEVSSYCGKNCTWL